MELAVINDRQKPPDTQKETKMKTIDEKEKKAVLRQARDAVKLLTSLPPVPSQKPEKQPSKAERTAVYRYVAKLPKK